MAGEKELRSIAFPAISTGVYGYPIEAAAEVAVAAIREALPAHPSIEAVRLVCFSERHLAAYEQLLGGRKTLFPC